MLFILIPILWLAVVATIVAACKLAARADALATGPAPRRGVSAADPVLRFPGLTVWECSDPSRVRGLSLALPLSSARPLGARAASARSNRARVGSGIRGPRARGPHRAARA
jgi:hypothetical protein